jgi:hypothetical protein
MCWQIFLLFGGKNGVKHQKIAFLINGDVPESQCFREFIKFLEFLLALTLDECQQKVYNISMKQIINTT